MYLDYYIAEFRKLVFFWSFLFPRVSSKPQVILAIHTTHYSVFENDTVLKLNMPYRKSPTALAAPS